VEDNYDSKEEAKRAMDVYCYRLAKYIGAYAAAMDGRLDAVVFTGGIGENSAPIREITLNKLGLLGFDVDHDANLKARFGNGGEITKAGSTKALVIPTNEEWVIAHDALELVGA
ncbi:MAG: acetate kinase, partial [Aeromonas veronii]